MRNRNYWLMAAAFTVPTMMGGCASQQSSVESLLAKSDQGWMKFQDYDRGKHYLEVGDYGLAIESFDADLAKNPNSVRSLNGEAIAYDRIGRSDVAERLFAKALAVDATSPDTLSNLAYLYLVHGDTKGALELAQRAQSALSLHAEAAPAPLAEVLANNEALMRADAPKIAAAAPPAPLQKSADGVWELDASRHQPTTRLEDSATTAPVDSGPLATPVQPNAPAEIDSSMPSAPTMAVESRPLTSVVQRTFDKAPTQLAGGATATSATASGDDQMAAAPPLSLPSKSLVLPETPVSFAMQTISATAEPPVVELSTEAPPVSLSSVSASATAPLVSLPGRSLSLPDAPVSFAMQTVPTAIEPPVVELSTDESQVSLASAASAQMAPVREQGPVVSLPTRSLALPNANVSFAMQTVPTTIEPPILELSTTVPAGSPQSAQLADAAQPAPALAPAIVPRSLSLSETVTFTSKTAPAAIEPPDLQTDAVAMATAAHVSIANGSGRNGMARRFARYLSGDGLRIAHLINAKHFGHPVSSLFYHSETQAAAEHIAAMLPVRPHMVELHGRFKDAVELVVGKDLNSFDVKLASRRTSGRTRLTER
jgi:LytR cell envelope-related transcriptional attenuator